MHFIRAYAASFLVFIGLDGIWLSLTAHALYRALLAPILIPGVRVEPAVAFYFLQVLGIQLFVLPRANRILDAAGFGAGFGIFTYEAYDLTNWATLRGWTFGLTATDITWGAVVTAAAAAAGHAAAGRTTRAIRGPRPP